MRGYLRGGLATHQGAVDRFPLGVSADRTGLAPLPLRSRPALRGSPTMDAGELRGVFATAGLHLRQRRDVLLALLNRLEPEFVWGGLDQLPACFRKTLISLMGAALLD